ncbi:hypothetical protein H3S90_10850 [Bartonella sp. W8097]|uniref:hypothetical protein n=1 Tax=Bartonella apihabitans TaxID=2750929 RepID=UPI0018DB26AB|nr:hypothetical protein [Bartonella apihabitans]MBI0021576.1 hypothetical protein [Bartonella apihabitans]
MMKNNKSRITNFVSVAPIATLIATSMLLSGCGGRDAHPVALTNPNDSVMDCAGISREFHANERQIQAVIHERTNAQGKNVALGAAGIFFFPAWFFMDPKSPERVEIDALRNRNGVLQEIARTKNCAPMQSQLTEAYKQLDSQKAAKSQKK